MSNTWSSGRCLRLVICAAVLSVLTLSGCASGQTPSGEAANPEERVAFSGGERSVKVGVLRQPHLSHALFYDRYLPTDVSLEIVPFANSTEIKNAVVSGDLAFGVTGITAALQGAASDEPVVVVASAADGGSAVVAKEGAGIVTVADLRGKRIGYVPGSAQDILLRLTLRDAGLDPSTDVQLLKVQFADMPAALARGDIDAFSGAETGPSDALVQGGTVLVTEPYDTPMGKINIVLVTSRELISSDPDLVRAVVAVHARATDHMRANPDQWAAAVAAKYGFSEKSLQLAIQNIELRWQLDDAYLAQTAVLGQEQLALGQIRQEPDYSEFVDASFVQEIG
jgi:NitT/TauT family transport system substrate-binding protein